MSVTVILFIDNKNSSTSNCIIFPAAGLRVFFLFGNRYVVSHLCASVNIVTMDMFDTLRQLENASMMRDAVVPQSQRAIESSALQNHWRMRRCGQ